MNHAGILYSWPGEVAGEIGGRPAFAVLNAGVMENYRTRVTVYGSTGLEVIGEVPPTRFYVNVSVETPNVIHYR